MSTLAQLASNVTRNLDDLSANFYDQNVDIIPSIQDGYNLIAAITESVEKRADVNFVSDLVYYDMSAYISDYLRIFGIFNNNTNRWMIPCTLIELYRIRDNWEGANDEPYWFLPIDYKTVAFFPTKTLATGSMTVMYKAKADTLSSNVQPTLPNEHHNVLEFYSTDDLLDQCQEWTKALDYAGMTDKSIDKILKVLRERSSPNHLYYKHDTY